MIFFMSYTLLHFWSEEVKLDKRIYMKRERKKNEFFFCFLLRFLYRIYTKRKEILYVSDVSSTDIMYENQNV